MGAVAPGLLAKGFFLPLAPALGVAVPDVLIGIHFHDVDHVAGFGEEGDAPLFDARVVLEVGAGAADQALPIDDVFLGDLRIAQHVKEGHEHGGPSPFP